MATTFKHAVIWKVVGNRIQLLYGDEWKCSVDTKDVMSLAGIQQLLIRFSDRSYSYVSKQAIAELIGIGRELRAQQKAAEKKV